MQHPTTLKPPGLFMAFLSLVKANPLQAYDLSPQARGVEGYAEATMHFSGTINDIHVEKDGNVQEIYKQMAREHTSFVIPAASTSSGLEKRSKEQPPLCCPVAGQNWSSDDRKYTEDGISYLKGLKGGCQVPARACARISCSYNAGIYLCNDNTYEIKADCGYLASYAGDLNADCSTYFPFPIVKWYLCGQQFDTDGYNIIVRYEDNHC